MSAAMRRGARSRLWILLLLASAVAGCGRAGGGTGPTAVPTPSGPPQGWSGSARFLEKGFSPTFPGLSTRTWDGTVTWQRDATPDPALPAGSVRYVVAVSQMHFTYHIDGTLIGDGWEVCTIGGESQGALQPFQAEGPEDPRSGEEAEWKSLVTVGADGEYRGAIHSQVAFTVTYTCPFGNIYRASRAEIHLYLAGHLAEGGRRMQGEMPPDTTTYESITGSWDFAAR